MTSQCMLYYYKRTHVHRQPKKPIETVIASKTPKYFHVHLNLFWIVYFHQLDGAG